MKKPKRYTPGFMDFDALEEKLEVDYKRDARAKWLKEHYGREKGGTLPSKEVKQIKPKEE